MNQTLSCQGWRLHIWHLKTSLIICFEGWHIPQNIYLWGKQECDISSVSESWGQRNSHPTNKPGSPFSGVAHAAFCCASHSQAPWNPPHTHCELTANCQTLSEREKHLKAPSTSGRKDSRLLPEERKAEMQCQNLCWSTVVEGLGEVDCAAGWTRIMALSSSETTTQGVKGLKPAVCGKSWHNSSCSLSAHSISAACPLLPPRAAGEALEAPSPGAVTAPRELFVSSKDQLLLGIEFQLSWQEQSRAGNARGSEGCFHSLHISLRFAFPTGHRTHPKIARCSSDSSSEKAFNGKGAECFYGRAQSSGQRMAKLLWCVGWTLPVPITTALLLTEHKEESKLCSYLTVMVLCSRCCTSPEQRLWAQQHKTSLGCWVSLQTPLKTEFPCSIS